MKGDLINYLFSTGAIKVAPEGDMFLFTSGLISPYYISTHYLCGGEEASTEMLSFIDSFKGRPEKIVSDVAPRILELSKSNHIYDQVIQKMKKVAEDFMSRTEIDCISGGERRDWFFSIPLARALEIPHLFLYNDGLVLDDSGIKYNSSNQKRSIHVADLLTIGSSYTNKWVPALRSVNVDIPLSINCVDRVQGGAKNLKDAGINEVISLCSINEEFFESARLAGVITENQEMQMLGYYQEQFNSMRKFLIENPGFVKKSLNSDQKTKARMMLTLDNDLYQLGEKYISDVLE